jgi:hypothetical protein
VVEGIKNTYQLSSRDDVQDDAMSSVVIMMIIITKFSRLW